MSIFPTAVGSNGRTPYRFIKLESLPAPGLIFHKGLFALLIQSTVLNTYFPFSPVEVVEGAFLGGGSIINLQSLPFISKNLPTEAEHSKSLKSSSLESSIARTCSPFNFNFLPVKFKV